MSKHILFLHENTQGRDFVVGDIHGCYSHLMTLLKKVDFDSSVDRLFSVGDIFDRGPESFEMVEFVLENLGKWFFMVRGNHDDMFVDIIASKFPIRDSYRYGISMNHHARSYGPWIAHIFRDNDEQKIDKLIEAAKIIMQQPLAIVVGKGTPNRFNVTHSEFIRRHPRPKMVRGFLGIEEPDRNQPYHGKVTDETIDNWDYDDYAYVYVNQEREILKPLINGKQHHRTKMSITYSGHNAFTTGFATWLQRQLVLDTSAAYPYYDPKDADNPDCLLSMIQHGTNDVHQVGKNRGYRITEPDTEFFKRLKKKAMEKAMSASNCW